MKPPIVAQGKGINRAFQTVHVGDTVRRYPLVWRLVDYDTHPAKTAPNNPGLLVLQEGTDRPSGNFYLREKGYYRFWAQVYFMPDGGERSVYLGLFNLGADGQSDELVAVANMIMRANTHPSLSIDRTVLNTVEGTYFHFASYLSLGQSVSLAIDSDAYCWGGVEFLGVE